MSVASRHVKQCCKRNNRGRSGMKTVMGSNVAFIEKWICSEIDDCIPGNVEVARNGLDDTREVHSFCQHTALLMRWNISNWTLKNGR